MKRFIRRNIKHIITALLFVVFLCSAIGGIRIRSVQEVRREAQELAGIGVTTSPDSEKNEQEQVNNLPGDMPQTDPTVESSSSATQTDGLGQNGTTGEAQNDSSASKQNSTGENGKASTGKQKSSGENGKASTGEQKSSGESGKSSTGKQEFSGKSGKSPTGKQKSSGENGKASTGKQKSSGKSGKASTGKQKSSGKSGKSTKEKQGSGQKQSSGTVSSGRKVSDGSGTKPDRYHTDPVPAGKPEPINPGDQSVNGKKRFYVYLSIDVKTILDHKSDLKQGLEKYVPEDGWILPKTRVLCYEGETAWDVMSRECKARGISVQSTYTQFYGSVYMEGIHHIGEFDCGATSGWVYEVDGWIPNYSSSRYVMAEGEYLRWRYSCAGFGSDLDGIVKR